MYVHDQPNRFDRQNGVEHKRKNNQDQRAFKFKRTWKALKVKIKG